jgi:hypothetical protein
MQFEIAHLLSSCCKSNLIAIQYRSYIINKIVLSIIVTISSPQVFFFPFSHKPKVNDTYLYLNIYTDLDKKRQFVLTFHTDSSEIRSLLVLNDNSSSCLSLYLLYLFIFCIYCNYAIFIFHHVTSLKIGLEHSHMFIDLLSSEIIISCI